MDRGNSHRRCRPAKLRQTRLELRTQLRQAYSSSQFWRQANIVCKSKRQTATSTRPHAAMMMCKTCQMHHSFWRPTPLMVPSLKSLDRVRSTWTFLWIQMANLLSASARQIRRPRLGILLAIRLILKMLAMCLPPSRCAIRCLLGSVMSLDQRV